MPTTWDNWCWSASFSGRDMAHDGTDVLRSVGRTFGTARVSELGAILRVIVTDESRADGGLEPAQGFSLAERRAD